MTMITTTMMTTAMLILMTMTESSFSFSFVVTHQQRIIIERRQPYNSGASTTTTTTSLRGIDYDAIGNNSNNNNENIDEYCDFDTPGRIPTTSDDINNENCIELPIPNIDWTPVQVVQTCMKYLQTNNEPHTDSGLEVCYNFSSDSCRMANGGSLESFLLRANNPVFQTLVNCQSYEILNIGPEIQGTQTRGTMQTVLINVIPKIIIYPPKLNSWGEVIITKDVDDDEAKRNNNERRFLWTLMKERRPPRQGYFLVHECIACDNAYALH
jgi:hypothetical protein